MNLLSLLSAISAYSFVLTAIYIIRLNPKAALNRTAALVNGSFAVWSFCYIFFHAAADLPSAWFWHRLSAAGWIPFCAFAVHFFFSLSEAAGGARRNRILALVYLLPAVLLAYALFGGATPAAKGFVTASGGAGWAYLSNAGSPWAWAYVAYVVGYFAIGLSFARRWAKRSGRPRHRIQGNAVIVLDVIVISAAFYTDLALPFFGFRTPPVGNLLTVGWMAGFIYIIRKYKLMTIYEAASAELILDTIIDPVLLLDRRGIIMKCNRGCSLLLGYPDGTMEGNPFSRYLAAGRYRQESIEVLFKRKKLSQIEIQLVDARGEPVTVLGSFSLAETRLDGPIGIVANLHDIGELKKAQAELHRIANYDTLTELPNRRLFFGKLEEAIAEYRRAGEAFAVAFADLDGFKEVNDIRGHDVGDALLAAVAERLRALLGPEDTAARVGGDEFVLILRGRREAAEAAEFARSALAEPIAVRGERCPVGLSVGVARCPEDGRSADELMGRADERMYEDKRKRKEERPKRPHFHTGAS